MAGEASDGILRTRSRALCDASRVKRVSAGIRARDVFLDRDQRAYTPQLNGMRDQVHRGEGPRCIRSVYFHHARSEHPHLKRNL